MNVKILGPGCSRCKALAKFTEQAVQELGINCTVEKVTELREMVSFGIMATPGLVIDGVVKVAGRVPSIAELKRILQEAS